MKTRLSAVCIILSLCIAKLNAQNTFPATGAVGIGTLAPNASSLLDVTSTNKGVLVPRMTKAQRDAISTPATGLLVYQTNSTPGFYYYSGTAWVAVSPVAGASKTLANLTAPTAVNVDLLPGVTGSVNIGSSTNSWKDLYMKGAIYLDGEKVIRSTIPDQVTAFGRDAGLNTLGTSAYYNSAFGYEALKGNYSASHNTAFGARALSANYGEANTAVGSHALQTNTTGRDNVAFGIYSLKYNATGNGNTAIGSYSQELSTTSSYNTSLGFSTLYYNTTGSSNTALGYGSLDSNLTGSSNSTLGEYALRNNTSGNSNIAIGAHALRKSKANSNNVAVGDSALYNYNDGAFADYMLAAGTKSLYNNTTGFYNTALGGQSMYYNSTGYGNTAVGAITLPTLTTGTYNTAIGYGADISGAAFTNSTALGYNAKATASNQVMLGNASVTVVRTFGTIIIPSDGRFKKNIKENVPGLDFIKALKPVTYNYDVHGLNKHMGIKESSERFPDSPMEKAIAEKEKKIYTGFIAQDVEKTADQLGYDFSGVYKPQNDKDPYGLSYSDFVVPLVKAVQELSKQNEDLKNEKDNQQKQMDELKKMLLSLQAKFESCSPCGSATAQTQSSVTLINTATLEQNIPNPFTNTTIINYSLPQKFATAQIMITDQNGKTIKLVNISGAGKGSLKVDAATLAAGAFHYSLLVDGKIIGSKQMVHLK